MRRNLLLALGLLLFASTALADERILSFASAITVYDDGSMQVTETIEVNAEGKQIKRGIYRDFPTDYRDRGGNRVRVGFEIVDMRRDGQREDWHTERRSNGIRVYIGRKEHHLAPGIYRYALTYRTNRQLGFFTDHDELYWNVTGNDWAFPIDAASATVRMPARIPPRALSPEAYTGPRGSKGQDYTAAVDADGSVHVDTTRPLKIGEGLTLAVSWPKGYITAPTSAEAIADILRDNHSWLFGLVGLLLLLGYYLLVWLRVGRDPEPGVVITRYTPPQSLPPASLRFITQMGYDHKAFTSAIVNLAVKGLIAIREVDGVFSLERTAQPETGLGPGEGAILKHLFRHRGTASLVLEQAQHTTISAALTAHTALLERNYEKIYFVKNSGWLIPGFVGSLLVLGATLLGLPGSADLELGAFLSLWLAFWSLGVYALGRKVWSAWNGAHSLGSGFGALGITVFALPFFVAEIAVMGILAKQVSPALPATLVAAVGLNLLFYHLLKAPTRVGRRLLDQIEGFREFLEIAERDEMNLRNPPEKTPQLFERFLPYALALDVEQRWMERFAAVFQGLQEQGESYRPGWYHGSHWNVHQLGGFAGAVGGALSSAIASSSTAPGSSSGAGGGGSSGGGGGGGGGGGW